MNKKTLAQKIQTLFLEKGWSLALAESCTGGGVAATLVQIPDCSGYFFGGVVAYCNEAKKALLGVRDETLEKYGAVSLETAQQMAQGASKKFNAHFALSTTGIAGPSGGSENKPIGMVCFAIASQDHVLATWTSYFSGERERIIESAIHEGLLRLWENCSNRV